LRFQLQRFPSQTEVRADAPEKCWKFCHCEKIHDVLRQGSA
jgi:hypothetical protein